jgi:hypothetical protein
VGIAGGDAYIIRLTNSIELSGRVVGDRGEPWAHALVQPTAAAECERIGSNAWAEALDAAVTDPDGAFAVGIEPSRYLATDVAADLAPSLRFCVRLGDRVWDADVRRTGPAGAALELHVLGPGRPLESSPETVAVVHGRVTCHGVPVADALIVHEGDPYISQDRARTRWDGTFTLLLRSEGAGTMSIEVPSAGADRFPIAAVPGAVVYPDIEVACGQAPATRPDLHHPARSRKRRSASISGMVRNGRGPAPEPLRWT